MGSTLNKRKCGCGQFIATHDNGTLKRHTRQSLPLADRVKARRVRCQYSGKFPPAIVRMRFDVNNQLDNRIALVTESLKLSKAENNKELIAECQTRLRELNAEKYPRTQILLSHKREGTRKAQKMYTRHVSGGQVKNRKRYSVTVMRTETFTGPGLVAS